MSLGSVLRFLFDAFIGGIIGHIGAALLNKLPSFYNYKHRKAITYAVIIVFAFLGVYFNITQQPAIFINLAFELHPAGIAGTIVLLAIFISILYIGIADVLKSKTEKRKPLIPSNTFYWEWLHISLFRLSYIFYHKSSHIRASD